MTEGCMSRTVSYLSTINHSQSQSPPASLTNNLGGTALHKVAAPPGSLVGVAGHGQWPLGQTKNKVLSPPKFDNCAWCDFL